MGRALFSHTYSSVPAVRTEPEPIVDICEKWGIHNRFDPDSDEFFNDAEYEAFIDNTHLRREQEALDQSRLAMAEVSLDSSDSSDSGGSDTGSPMAIGSDDPAMMIADAYSNVSEEWQQRFLEATSADSEWRRDPAASYNMPRMVPAFTSRASRAGSDYPPMHIRSNRPRSVSAVPVFLPHSSLRNSTTANDIQSDHFISPPRSPTLRRTVNITPITIPIQAPARSPSPDSDSPATPSTPPAQTYRRRAQAQSLVSPSPPPSVSPRFYSWQSHPIPAMPLSPTVVRGNRDGPLTNPHARISFARLGSTQPVIVERSVI